MAAAFPDEEQLCQSDIISLDEVDMWTTDSLKDFCRRRGHKVSGTKSELRARVYCLYNQQIPEDPTAAEQILSKKQDYKQLYSAGPGYDVDPARLKLWLSEKEGMSQWPPTNYVDMVKFIQKNGCSFSKAALTSYKTGKAYSLFQNDYIQEVYYHGIKKIHPCCFLKATCKRSNRINDPPHDVWVKIAKSSGEVISAYCTCYNG